MLKPMIYGSENPAYPEGGILYNKGEKRRFWDPFLSIGKE